MIRAAAIAANKRVRRLVAGVALFAVMFGLGMGSLATGKPDPAGRLDRARDLAFARQPEAAMREVRRALAELGDDGDRDLRLRALARAAQITDAQLGESRANDALGYYRRIIAEYPKTPEAYDAGVRVSEILQRMGSDLHAEQQLVAVVNAFPKQAGVERLLLRACRMAQDNRRYEEANAYATRLLKEYGQSELAPEAQSAIGSALHLEGKHGDAIQAYQVVADRWPRTAEAARALLEEGNCLAETGDLSHAIARYIEALPDHPDPISVQRTLERVRRRFTAQRMLATGSKAVAFGRGHEE